MLLRGAEVAARAVLKESLRLPGARMVRRQASWTKDANKEDIPELVLNRLLVAEVFLQMLASGLGTVALVWATVVLLGGFSTMLVRLDFWLTTAIVFVETARIVGYNSAPEAKFFVDVPASAFFGRNILQIGSATGFVGLITMGPALIALAPIFAASACMTLSIWRLLSIDGYGGSSTESSNANLKPALILFYALVLSQGVLFLMWFVVAMSRSAKAKKLRQYFKNEETITNRFIASTLDTCVEKGVVNTLNRTVITFAEELLQSEQSGDHGVAVSVLHVVVIERKERRAGAIEQICSSEQLVGMLFRLLSSKSPLDLDTRTLAAKIVKKLSNKLYLANIPGAANVLSSMLDACFMETRAQTSHTTGQTLVSIKSDNGEIIVHGLQILCKLADDPGNCTEMNNTKDLVSKIIASLTHGLHKAIASESATVEVVIASLGLLVKLTSRTGESSTELRRTILDDSRTVGNILWILSNSSHTDVKILAVKILTTLTLGRLSIKRKRLILGQVGSPDLQQLVTMLSDDGNSKENRAVTAQLLAQLCANSRTDHDRNRLRPISSALSTVLKTISNTQCTNDDADTWRFLGCFLGLTMQICVNLGVGADAFATAVKEIPEEDLVLVKKLKEIVDTCIERLSRNSCMDGENDISLMIMKAAAKLATWMMKMNHHYITHFCQVNILQKLEDATNAMAKLEEYMILTGGCPDGSGRHETLSSLVKGVKDLVSQQQAWAHIRQIV